MLARIACVSLRRGLFCAVIPSHLMRQNDEVVIPSFCLPKKECVETVPQCRIGFGATRQHIRFFSERREKLRPYQVLHCVSIAVLCIAVLYVSFPDLFSRDFCEFWLDSLVFLVPRSGLLEPPRGRVLPGLHKGFFVIFGPLRGKPAEEGTQ